MGGRLRQLCESVTNAIAKREELREVLCSDDGCKALQAMLDGGGEVVSSDLTRKPPCAYRSAVSFSMSSP